MVLLLNFYSLMNEVIKIFIANAYQATSSSSTRQPAVLVAVEYRSTVTFGYLAMAENTKI